MKFKRILAAAAVLMLLFSGCAAKKAPAVAVFEGATWEMTMDEVRATKDEGVIVDGPSEGVLNWIQTTETEWFAGRMVTVAYVFSNDRLSNVTVQLFVKDGEKVEEAIADTHEVLHERFGEETDDHWFTDNAMIELRALDGSKQSYLVLITPLTEE